MQKKKSFLCFQNFFDELVQLRVHGISGLCAGLLQNQPFADGVSMKLRTPEAMLKCPATAAANRIWKRTTAVPSLNRLSPSKSTVRRLETVICLAIESTAIGSVAEMIAPKRRAIKIGIPISHATM